MTTAARKTVEAKLERIPPLQTGDRLTRAEFERRYDAMPDLKKAELIEGVVYMPPPSSFEGHSGPHFNFINWLGLYSLITPGVQGGDNATLLLDLDNEPQPDAFLRLIPACGGQSRTDKKGYVVGAPELVAEVSASSASYDLHDKLQVYLRNKVQEYIVWRVWDREIDWFYLHEGRYLRLPLGSNKIYKSKVFPGLWLAPAALIRGDWATVKKVSEQGLASPEHAAFVDRLQKLASKKRP